jgi:hypothetical protein
MYGCVNAIYDKDNATPFVIVRVLLTNITYYRTCSSSILNTLLLLVDKLTGAITYDAYICDKLFRKSIQTSSS